MLFRVTDQLFDEFCEKRGERGKKEEKLVSVPRTFARSSLRTRQYVVRINAEAQVYSDQVRSILAATRAMPAVGITGRKPLELETFRSFGFDTRNFTNALPLSFPHHFTTIPPVI